MRRVPSTSLWIGHCGETSAAALRANAIAAVVDLALNEPAAVLARETTYCRFPLVDGGGNSRWLLRAAIDTIAGLIRSSTPTLVYCSAGMSRSPAIAAAALAKVRPCDVNEALREIASIGPADISPGLWNEIVGAIEDPRDRVRAGFSA